jgi:hypothetical protein
MAILLALIQGVYFVLTGVWPLVSIRTFMKVTGPKTDLWLVKTVGLLVTVIGIVLLIGAAREQVSLEVLVLAVGSATALFAIDVIYVARRVIAPIYLLDAVLEAILIAAWAIAWLRGDVG